MYPHITMYPHWIHIQFIIWVKSILLCTHSYTIHIQFIIWVKFIYYIPIFYIQFIYYIQFISVNPFHSIIDSCIYISYAASNQTMLRIINTKPKGTKLEGTHFLTRNTTIYRSLMVWYGICSISDILKSKKY
jgi:hypothetical protein